MRALLALMVTALPAMALPSGLVAERIDVLEEVQPSGETWLVLRYLAPALAEGGLSYEEVVPDLDSLCASDGLQAAAHASAEIAQIVIVLMDRPVERGVPDLDALQFIGAYLPTGEGCEWQ